MAFKQKPDKKARLEDLNKTTLIKTVRTLQRRETKLLNQVAKLEAQIADVRASAANINFALEMSAVEFGYRAGEKGECNLEMTLSQWGRQIALPVEQMTPREISAGVGDASFTFPWEISAELERE